MTRARPVLVIAVLALSLAFACAPIRGTPLSIAPLNAGCPDLHACDAYAMSSGARTAPPSCDKGGRCVFSGGPAYEFTVIVSVPDSSFYAPGRSFVLSSKDLNPLSGVTPRGACILPTCVQLPELTAIEGKYLVSAAAATAVGYPIGAMASLPVRVSYVPLIGVPAGVPVDSLFMSSRVIRKAVDQPEVSYIDGVPVGRYLRVAYPEPPYDEFFPPAIGEVPVPLPPQSLLDLFVLGDPKTAPLDAENGNARVATITSVVPLDGWRAWLADATTQRRISSIRTLRGTKSVVRLDTVGRPLLGDDVLVIIAPPEGWLAVPRLESRLVGGSGFEALEVPELSGPATAKGVVAHGEGTLTGIPSRLTFTSTKLRLLDGSLQPLLKYKTVVSTDDTGNFSTVLPPGLYDVIIEPAEGRGFAKSKDTFDTATTLGKIYRPPPRTVATGQVMLTDGRPLAEADVYAIPSDVTLVATAVQPRPARARTDENGMFRFEMDQGQYELTVAPQAGTGFPRAVQIRSIGTGTAEIGVIQIGPPARLAFTLRDPSQNLIVNALVRVFAVPTGRGPPAVEIGRAMTTADAEGLNCEILLAQQAL